MFLRRFTWLGLLVLCISVLGCSTTRDLYYWGGYEEMLNTYYSRPGDMTAARQIEILQRDVTEAKNRGSRVAPGVYAHLGLALADVGNVNGAKAAFSQEVALYPESKHMLEAMVNRADTAKALRESRGSQTTQSRKAIQPNQGGQ